MAEEDVDAIQTRAFGGEPLDIWNIPAGEHPEDGQTDAMMHFLQSRAAERIMLASEDVHAARKAYQKAEEFLVKENQACGAFLVVGGNYGSLTMHEVLRRHFPERLQAITEDDDVNNYKANSSAPSR